jgi:RNA polymerase sigma factor (sigma-70 family)
MNTKTDQELLRDYARSRSEAAFAELARRHVDFVYSAALRMVRDAHLAQDVSQNVFVALAQNAGQLMDRPVLAGWLHRTTQNQAVKTIRSEVRRRTREQEAMAMKELLSAEAEAPWESIEPHLDVALGELSEAEREAVLLRYFQQKSAREMAGILGLSDVAAQKRVSRAVEKLRECFSKRGIKVGVAGLASLISANAVQTAPVGVIGAITAAVSGASLFLPGLTVATAKLGFSTLRKAVMLTAALSITGLISYKVSIGFQHSRATSQIPVEGVSDETDPVLDRKSSDSAGGSPVRASDLRRTKHLAGLAEELRRALHKPWPSKYGTRSYPTEEMVQALVAFGEDRKEAFGTLFEAANESDTEVRKKAISAMGWVGRPPTPSLGNFAVLGEPAPEVKPFLWKVLQSKDQDLSHFALSSLRNTGLDPGEIRPLTDLLSHTADPQLFRYLPEAIAATIQKDPIGTAPYVRDVEGLLNDANDGVQFAAACALAKSQAGTNPRILEALVTGLRDKNHHHELMALETLQRLGAAAEPALQAILNYADATQDDLIKKIAFGAIGKIREDLRADFPEIDKALSEKERIAKWDDKFTSKNLSYEELLGALKEPMFAARAAKRLGEMGTDASAAIPNLVSSLSGLDQIQREQIVTAIHQINPELVILKVSSEVVARAATHAYMEAMDKLVGEQPKKATKLLDRLREVNSEWYTQEEVSDAAKRLEQCDLRVHQAFLKKLLEKDPSLRTLFGPELRK